MDSFVLYRTLWFNGKLSLTKFQFRKLIFNALRGISGVPSITSSYGENIKDDPVVQSNIRGTLTYADAGNNTRSTQIFINYANNTFLDAQGFAPFGEVVSGMTFIDHIYAGYGGTPSQASIETQGNTYLHDNFPLLTYLKKTSVQ